MLLDRKQRNWLIITGAAAAAAVFVYIPYARHSLRGPRGGSAVGLTFGIVGSALMIFAGLLSVRKKFPVWRIGSAQTWMKGHLWLGLLSFPLILLHSGFRFGGPLTTVLMWLFIIVIASGVLGTVLQHYLPRVLTTNVTLETIYEEIPRVRQQLLDEAVERVAAIRGSSFAAPNEPVGLRALHPRGVTVAADVDDEAAQRLRHFFTGTVRPFLENPTSRTHPLTDSQAADRLFGQVRIVLPSSLEDVINDLENICEEHRQLNRQERLHKILHGWLVVHVPLSFALLLLAAVHSVMALFY